MKKRMMENSCFNRNSNKYLKKYSLIFAACVIFAASFSVLYKLLNSGTVIFVFSTFLKILFIGIGLFVLICMELQITKWAFGNKPGFAFRLKELLISALLSILVLVCFLPVALDYMHNSFPALYSAYGYRIAEYDSSTAADTGQIIKGKMISQTFISPGNSYYYLTLKGATYKRINHGTLHIELIDEDTGQTLMKWDRPAEEFDNKADFNLFIDPFKHQNLAGHHMRINIMSDDSFDGDALTLYYSKEDCYKDGALYLDGADSGGDLIMSLNVVYSAGSQEVTKIWLCLFLALAVEAMTVFILRRIIQKTGSGDSSI